MQETFLYLPSRRALSSVGLEHLPYKQRVVGSNPTEPTVYKQSIGLVPNRYLPKRRIMAVTRLQRKARKNKLRSTQRKATMKRLLAMPVIKNIDAKETAPTTSA